jgi:hypothetical protein
VDQAKPETLFAQRVFTCVRNGLTVEVNASVFVPVKGDEGDYACRYCITTNDVSFERTIHGIDTLQSLHLALYMMRNDLLQLDDTSDWRFLGEPGLHLPISANPET